MLGLALRASLFDSDFSSPTLCSKTIWNTRHKATILTNWLRQLLPPIGSAQNGNHKHPSQQSGFVDSGALLIHRSEPCLFLQFEHWPLFFGHLEIPETEPPMSSRFPWLRVSFPNYPLDQPPASRWNREGWHKVLNRPWRDLVDHSLDSTRFPAQDLPCAKFGGARGVAASVLTASFQVDGDRPVCGWSRHVTDKMPGKVESSSVPAASCSVLPSPAPVRSPPGGTNNTL